MFGRHLIVGSPAYANSTEAGAMKLRSCWTLAFAVAILGACGRPEDPGASPALIAFSPTVSRDNPSQELAGHVSVPLEVVDGRFLGIGQGSSLAEALQVLGVKPVLESADQFATAACSAVHDERWVMHAEGLTLVFEGTGPATARLANWQYTGGPAMGFTEMVAPKGITVGGTRQDILAAYDVTTDSGNFIDVDDPVQLRFGLDRGSISWFGSTSC